MTDAVETPPPRGQAVLAARSSDIPPLAGAPSSGVGALLAVLIAFGLVSTAFNVVNPLFEAPDESSHYYFAQHLAQGYGLPVQPTDPDARGPWEQEGSQPPLYYVLAAPVVAAVGGAQLPAPLWVNPQNTMGHPTLVGNENRFVHRFKSLSDVSAARLGAVEESPWRGYTLAAHLLRLLGTLAGAATLVAVWAVARRALPGRPWLWAATAAAAGLNPQFAYLSASVTNDVAVALLAAATLALVLRVADGDGGRGALLAVAVAAGLAPVAKLSGLALTAFAAASLVGIGWRRRSWRFALGGAGLVLLAALLCAGWWYARNAALYGDLTGIPRMLPGNTGRSFHLGAWLAGLPAELRGVWLSSWGLFGWFTVLLPAGLYRAIDVAAVAALVGLARSALGRGGPAVRWGVVAWLAAWLAVVAVSLLRWMTIAKGGQGRLMFPALTAVAVILVIGWRGLAPARLRDAPLAGVVALFMLALCAVSVGTVHAAYAPPVDSMVDASPPPHVTFGEGLDLVPASTPDRVTAGEPVAVSMRWHAARDLAADGVVEVRLEVPTKGGNLESAARSYPGRGLVPPPLMVPGREYGDLVTVPELTAGLDYPVLGRLAVLVFDPASGHRWHLADDSTEWSTGIVVAPAAPPRVPDDLAAAGPAAELGNDVQLFARVTEGVSPTLRVAWVPGAGYAAAPGVELSALIHVLDASGTVLAALDRAPSDPPLPTSRWLPGDITLNEVPLPELPGAVTVEVGLYDPTTMERVTGSATLPLGTAP